jgi:4-amino-4-deoxy-L-arabinose transferase-like glycosyltransferase
MTAPYPAARPVAQDAPLVAWLLLAAAASLALRLWIARVLPITGDEAYFYWWGVFPDWGYYDHPPMVGWLIAAMRWLTGDDLLSIRMPVVLLPLFWGAILWWGLAAFDRARATWALLFFWLAPLNWLNVLITTDTPLVFWSALSVAALMRAEARTEFDGKAKTLYGLAGLFIGCAFLSKYFAVVLGLSCLVYFAAFRRERWPGLLLLVSCSLPGPLINLAWNMEHGWSNIMFNAINRNATEVVAWHKPLVYLGMMLYLATPACAWLAWRHRSSLAATARANLLLACVVIVPFAFFLLLSVKKVIGLHWVLLFYPFLFALLALALPRDKLRPCAIGLAWFAALHVLAVIGIGLSSPEDWKNNRLYPQIVRSLHTEGIVEQARAPGAVLMANAYTPASIYGFQMRQYMPVFGRGNFHARQDDLLVDFSLYQGKTIHVIHGAQPDLDDYKPYFEEVRLVSFKQAGVPFYVVQGRNFNYPAYKSGVLADIHQRYYNIPAWLPMTACPFCERLCGAARCPR